MIDQEPVNQRAMEYLLRAAIVALPEVSSPFKRRILEVAIERAQGLVPLPPEALTEVDRALINAAVMFPVGQSVRFYPWADSLEHLDSKVRSKPWALGHGSIVIKIDGKAGGVSVDHLEVI